MRGIARGLMVVLVLLVTGCGAPDSGTTSGTWVGTITTEGNVTTVINESGSVWDGSATLVEEASIGVEIGEDPYMFGSLAGVVAGDDRIYVLDRQVPVLRMYDFDGRHLGDIGGVGSGPGEYRRPSALGIADDGRLFVRDDGQARILVYSSEGMVLETWNPQKAIMTSLPMAVTRAGEYFDPIVIERADDMSDWKWGMQRYGPEGAIGAPVPVPETAFRSAELEARSENGMTIAVGIPYYPSEHWSLAPTGAMVSGTSDDYRYEVHHPDGRVTIVLKLWEPVAVPEGAAQAAKRQVYETFRKSYPEWSWDGPGIPDFMPAYSSLVPDGDGRVWVLSIVGTRHDPDCDVEERGRRCWRDVTSLDVFGPDGRYLGAIETPDSLAFSSRTFIDGTTVVAFATDEAGTIMVKRYRLVLPGEAGPSDHAR